MQILCQPCNQYIELKDKDTHDLKYHPEAMQDKVAAMLNKVSERVDYIYKHEPSAVNNNGVLLSKYFKYFKVYTCRYIYEPENKAVGLLADNWHDYAYGLKHCESVTREGRNWRAKHILKEDLKQKQRVMQEAWSRPYWAKEGVDGAER